jgi:uncharacterized DUF497 family protein
MRFEWDPTKAKRKLAKHRVSFSDAATAFTDPLSFTVFDPDHSDDEDRFVLLGSTYLVTWSSSPTCTHLRGAVLSAGAPRSGSRCHLSGF